MTNRREVIVVGAGAVGLALALGLARRGVDVLVLEKEAGTSEHSRAPGIWPRTQEVLASLGVLDRFLGSGIAMPVVELWDADRDRRLLRLPIEELHGETPCARLLVLPQSDTERLLCEAVRATRIAEVRFSQEVVGVTQDGARTKVHYRANGCEATMEAHIVVGCDGAHSRIREEIGGHLSGLTYKAKVGLADVTISGGPAPSAFRLSTRSGLAIAIPIAADTWRLVVPFFDDERSLDDRTRLAVRNLFSRETFQTVWQSTFRLHRRTSSRWIDRRIALAGDAAHPTAPSAARA